MLDFRKLSRIFKNPQHFKFLEIPNIKSPPVVEITKRTPEDAAREAVGIFEPYDIEDE